MIRRGLAVGAGLLMVVATVVFGATASQATPVYTTVQKTFTGVGWGTSNAWASCPSGSTPVGGGAVLIRTDVDPDVYTDPAQGYAPTMSISGQTWYTSVTVPAGGTHNIDAFVICRS